MSSTDNDTTQQVKQEPSPATLEGSSPKPTKKDGEETVATDEHHDEKKKHHLFGKKDKDKKGKLDINKAKADAEAEKNEKVRGVPAASPNTVAREQEKDRKEHPVQQPQKGEKKEKEEGEQDDGLTPEERIDKALKEVEATTNGLTAAEVKTRFDKYGPNALEEKHENKFWAFFKYAWNPLSWTMEIAAIIAIVLIDYVDFILILALLTLNSTIAYLEERGSGNAIAALKSQLAPTTKVLRDGEVQSTESANLVPGDIILLRLGDVIPADAVLLQGDTLKVDQSSLTGESLPSTKGPGDLIYCNAVIKQGEERAVVTKTGVNTFFGKAAALVRDAEESNHFQKVLRSIGFFCIGIIAFMVVMELAFAFGYHNNYCNGVGEVKCPSLNNILVIIVGGIPIAMPTVLSVTMAIGAGQLAAKQAIVSRLTAIEELAGMDVLCSDKTGTLTLNKLSVAEAKIYGGEATEEAKTEVLFNAALASKPENEDAIDIAMVKSLSEEQKKRLATYRQLLYHPFDPVGKKTFAKVKDANGKTYYAAKGAPQIILRESANKDQIQEAVEKDIAELAKGGYRSLGISTSEDGHSWTMTGIVPLFDPPRHDTQATIVKCKEMGVAVKMITGDQLAIAIETARLLGLGLNFHTTEKLDGLAEKELTDLLMGADGFAQVFPEHKYNIVHGIQQAGHTVGMTGDGVNDAPALKQADIGIAVHGATDAARAAADIVLLTPGLSVIIDAIIGSRKIFQRMRNYCMYSLSVTVRIALTFGLLTIIWDFFFPPIAIVILAIVNDGTIMTISKDRVKPSQEPDHWDLKEIFIIAIALGMWLSASTLILFWLAHDTTFFQRNFGLSTLGDDTIRGLIYLQVSLSGLATIFVTRAHRFSWMERPGNLVLIAFILAQIIASILGAYGLDGYPFGPFSWKGSGWGYVLVAWVWCIMWFIPMDFIKLGIRALVRRGRGKRTNKKIASASRPGSQPATPGVGKGKTPMGTPKANPGNAAVPNGDRQAMRPQPTMAQSRPNGADMRDPGKMPREEMRSPTMRNRMQQQPVQGQSQPSLL